MPLPAPETFRACARTANTTRLPDVPPAPRPRAPWCIARATPGNRALPASRRPACGTLAIPAKEEEPESPRRHVPGTAPDEGSVRCSPAAAGKPPRKPRDPVSGTLRPETSDLVHRETPGTRGYTAALGKTPGIAARLS